MPGIYYLDTKHHNIVVICLGISYAPLRNSAGFKRGEVLLLDDSILSYLQFENQWFGGTGGQAFLA